MGIPAPECRELGSACRPEYRASSIVISDPEQQRVTDSSRVRPTGNVEGDGLKACRPNGDIIKIAIPDALTEDGGLEQNARDHNETTGTGQMRNIMFNGGRYRERLRPKSLSQAASRGSAHGHPRWW